MKEKISTTKPARRRRITFNVKADPGCQVALSGDFNNWCAEGKQMCDKQGNGLYSCTLMLAPGVYEYKFIIDGVWQIDRANKDWVQNSLGTLNSLLRVE